MAALAALSAPVLQDGRFTIATVGFIAAPWRTSRPAVYRARGGGGCSIPGLSTVTVVAFAGVARRRIRCGKRRHLATARPVSRKQWNERVKRIEGQRAVFDVTIPKPLGITPRNFTNRPGVGIAAVKKEGNADALNRRVILENEDGMWILEGDEVIAVDGKSCEGKPLEFVGPLVKGAKGDSITLTLCRNYQKGPVKVVWIPGNQMLTMKRGALLRTCADAAGADVRYSCKDGWCSSCWHTESTSNLVHRICKFPVPEDWDNVMPLVLLRADETFKQTGLLVKNLMQADGFLPPPPAGVDAKKVRKDVEQANVEEAKRQ